MTRSAIRPRLAWTVTARPVGDPLSAALLREYLFEVADRWYQLRSGRPSTREELDAALAEHTNEALVPPGGLLLVAAHGEEPAGCAGLELLDEHTAELKRVFIRPAKRGLGGGKALVDAVEKAAVHLGAERMVLDTRLDLVEARALYARLGYTDIPAFRHGELSEVWLGKRLS